MLNPKDISVLIVDDNDISRSMLRHILQSESFSSIAEAAGGLPALDWLSRNRAHLVCLDIMMPDIDGITILQHIKLNYPDTIVLMVTGDNKREIVMRAVEGGTDGFIIKPFNPSTLIGAVHASLSKTARGPSKRATPPIANPVTSTVAATPLASPAKPLPSASTALPDDTILAKPVNYYPDR